jgi:hypothetical protein
LKEEKEDHMSEGQELAEVEMPEIETTPEAGGMVQIQSKDQVTDLLYFAENVNAIIDAQNKIRMAILRLTQPADWTLFGEKAEIGFAPANRIGSTLGVSYVSWSAEKVVGTDEKGTWYRWEYQCDAVHGKRTIRVYGRAGSRDKFFGKAHGELRELHDIDEGNIKMAAMRAAKKEGVKDLFGLHHMDPDELKKFGIKLEKAGGHNFQSRDAQGKDAAELKTLTGNVEKVTQKLTKNNKTIYTVHMAEGDKFDTWSETDAKVAKASIADKKQITVEYTTNQYGNNVKTLYVVGAEGTAA